MKAASEILTAVKSILNTDWKRDEKKVVPSPQDIALTNVAGVLEGAVLYADMKGSSDLVHNYKDFFAAGYFLYVTHVDIYYKVSALQDDELTIESEMVKIGYIGGTIHQTIKKNDGTICLEADVDWACVSSETHRPCKVPEEFMIPELRIKK